jgi:hypothetical protein
MRAKIRHILSPDLDLQSDTVEEPTNFGALLQLLVGPSDGPGEESFEVIVCTPEWLRREVKEKGPIIGRHYLFVERYNPSQIVRFLHGQVESLEAETWKALGEKIGRIGSWEFEDYSDS